MENQFKECRPIIEFIDIPSGTFTMGSHENEIGHYDNQNQHQVSLSSFKMSKYAITFAQYKLFCDANHRFMPKEYKHGMDNYPVFDVCWQDAQDFAEWMNCRLPTEAEWEYACRAGTTSPYYWGNKPIKSKANIDGTKVMPVGTFKPNAWGLFEMHGNVHEWCYDWFGKYPSTHQSNPKGARNGEYRVLRGGSFFCSSESCTSASRSFDFPSFGCDFFIGFRIVKSDLDFSEVQTSPIEMKEDIIKSNEFLDTTQSLIGKYIDESSLSWGWSISLEGDGFEIYGSVPIIDFLSSEKLLEQGIWDLSGKGMPISVGVTIQTDKFFQIQAIDLDAFVSDGGSRPVEIEVPEEGEGQVVNFLGQFLTKG